MLALLWTWSSTAMAQATASNQQRLSAEQIDQMMAPVALYSDPLLAQVLMASTYPLEVVQADRWAKSHRGLKGDALTAALAKESWDDSVKSLVQVPNVLAMMADKLDWTQKVGDAVLAQQADVMDSIQRLRSRAKANDKLQSSSQQTVNVQTENQKDYIVIEPTSPTEIYVPYYQPAVVYGDWPYPAYPPLYFAPPPGYVTAGALAAGVAFGVGVAAGYALWGHCNWAGHNINVVSNRSVNINNFNRNTANFNKWEHNPDHRHGVRYNNDAVRQKYARTDAQAGRQVRQDFRGRDGERVLDPDRRPDAGDRRPEAGELRPGVGDRDRPGSGERANLGERERPQQRDADRGERADRGEGARPANRAVGGRPREGAFDQAHSGRATQAHADRGRQSYAGGSPARHAGGGRGRR
jgi:hypothetical protein